MNAVSEIILGPGEFSFSAGPHANALAENDGLISLSCQSSPLDFKVLITVPEKNFDAAVEQLVELVRMARAKE